MRFFNNSYVVKKKLNQLYFLFCKLERVRTHRYGPGMLHLQLAAESTVDV